MGPQPPRVLLVGVGGLGCPAALELLRRGVRQLRLVDPDTVALENLHRQVLFTDADLGRPKVEAAAAHLRALAGDARIEALHASFAEAQLDDVELVLEGTDDPMTKFAVNDACVARGVDCAIGGVIELRGTIVTVRRGGPCYRCVFEAPPSIFTETCAQLGVFGPAAGLVGTLLAERALGIERDGPGALLTIDVARDRIRALAVEPDPACPTCHLTSRA